jgi:Flp pilus assembly pilin Flp
MVKGIWTGVCRFHRDEDGASLVEFTIIMMLLFTVVLGFVDFGYALYQWNSASKAVQVGARLAAVSDPVDSDLADFTGLDGGLEPGQPIPFNPANPAFRRMCDGATETCTGDGAPDFDEDAFNRIVLGSDGDCGARQDLGDRINRPGMCDLFWRIQPENVIIEYVYTGLGFAGHPSGPVPTIVVRLQHPDCPNGGMPFQFFFLGGLMGFGPICMPPMTSTITGEDLSTAFE